MSVETQWTLMNVETGDALVPIGGRDATEKRLADLLEGGEDRYALVRRVVQVGDWEVV